MRKVIIVTGTTRSGSTLLDKMLGNSPDGISLGEIHTIFRPWLSRHLKRPFYNKEQRIFWSDIKQGSEREVYKNLFKKFDDVNFLVDSSKSVLWIRDQNKYSESKDYEIIPIIIFKTPLEYAYSMYKRNNLRNWDQKWIRTHLWLFYVLTDFFTVKYQQLAKNPASKLESICEKVGIDYFEGKEKFWNSDNVLYLFGSESIKKAGEIIYYEKQYEREKLDYLKKNINFENRVIK